MTEFLASEFWFVRMSLTTRKGPEDKVGWTAYRRSCRITLQKNQNDNWLSGVLFKRTPNRNKQDQVVFIGDNLFSTVAKPDENYPCSISRRSGYRVQNKSIVKHKTQDLHVGWHILSFFLDFWFERSGVNSFKSCLCLSVCTYLSESRVSQHPLWVNVNKPRAEMVRWDQTFPRDSVYLETLISSQRHRGWRPEPCWLSWPRPPRLAAFRSAAGVSISRESGNEI